MTDTHSLVSPGRKPGTTQAGNERRLQAACPFAYTLQLLGTRWRPAILWKIFEGACTYGRLKQHLAGISDRMLAQQLSALAAAGLLHKHETARGRARAVRYELTEAGLSLLPLLEQMQHWGAARLIAASPAVRQAADG